MWFYPVIALFVLLGLVGGVLAGGIFTIVLLPLAAIVLISAAVYAGLGAAAQRRSGGGGGSERPLPTSQKLDSGHVRTTPERLADARRAQQ
jgi:predicted membrane metal-binding protein